MSLWEQWRPWIGRQQTLLRELILMLLAMLVVGIYFLEHYSASLEQEREVQLKALAEQTARRAAEALASEDSISINLIGRETVALAPVAGVRFLNPEQVQVGLSGVSDADLLVSVPVALPDGELAGTLTLLGDNSQAPRQNIEAGFVLAVLCVLLLRLAVTLVRERLVPPQEPVAPSATVVNAPAEEPEPVKAAEVAVPSVVPDTPIDLENVLAQLRLSIVNFDAIRQRYTEQAVDEVLADYQRMLRRAAAVYGGQVSQPVGRQATVVFSQQPVSQAAFSALCAGLLFLRVVRLLTPIRKQQGKVPLEFKALMTTDKDADESWSLCLAGVPGRLQVPEVQLASTELDVKALYQPDRAQVAVAGDHKVRLQPVEQLAHRYQVLLRTQAETLVSEEEGGSGPNR
ncbi:hypothetical protein Y5S_01574 [Alcanivorax nanhaiticus]|uniref:Uncharacterized protein n=1 Tax=Alcanivorax nanhaiticus TaxID=1177154 RepID=A0A095URM1_9GAMM|nr:hypothetical protein [Alcanivorax nanhaiticus]KGD65140.1 hypothetical protein Y5S_01574 [Alcanivorax nanhaiticus]